jgi:hypothetical protein
MLVSRTAIVGRQCQNVEAAAAAVAAAAAAAAARRKQTSKC